jgi:hypothetical protein
MKLHPITRDILTGAALTAALVGILLSVMHALS